MNPQKKREIRKVARKRMAEEQLSFPINKWKELFENILIDEVERATKKEYEESIHFVSHGLDKLDVKRIKKQERLRLKKQLEREFMFRVIEDGYGRRNERWILTESGFERVFGKQGEKQ